MELNCKNYVIWDRDYCSEHEGKVSICKICNQKVSTVDIMKSCSDYIFQQYKECNNKKQDIKQKISVEEISSELKDILCMRYVYDFHKMHDGLCQGDVLMDRKLRRISLSMKYDEHDFNHSSSCIKK